jgi:Tfp pilus assembly protein PilF
VPRVFISHSGADNAFGLSLEQRLGEALDDDAVFYDRDGGPTGAGLVGGDEWLSRIEHEITERNVFVVLLSPEAFASPWVAKEVNLALTEAVAVAGKVIIPVLHKETTVRPFLTEYQWVSFLAPRSFDEAFAELLRAVQLGYSRRAELEAMRQARRGPPFDVALLPLPERFVGREEDLRWVLERLDPTSASGVAAAVGPGTGGLASIAAANGLGGIGKSALAGQVVRILYARDAFPDGIAVVLCNGLTDPATVLRRALARFDAYGREPEELELPALGDLARQVFSGRRALVVLDNVEADWPVEQVIVPLRVAGAAVLVTSRQRLPTQAVPAAASKMLELLSPEEAQDLFAEYAGRGTRQDLTAAEQTLVARIVQALGYHTLAVKLAAARAQGRDLAKVAEEYAADPRLGVHLKEGSEAVEVVLASSVSALPQPARRLFAAFAAFATADVGRGAVLDLAGQLNDPDPQGSLQAILDLRLVDSYLLNLLLEEADRERLRLHPLVRVYTEQLFILWNDEARSQAQQAIASWYASYTNATSDLALSVDEANVEGALEWAHAHEVDQEAQAALASICTGMASFWDRYDWTQASLRFLPEGIRAAQAIADRTQNRVDYQRLAHLMSFYGVALRVNGQLAEAESYFQQALVIRREIGDRRGEGIELSNLGAITLRRGQLAEAESYFQQALVIRRAVGDRRGEGIELSNLGAIARRRGQLAEAADLFQQALVIDREVGDRQAEGVDLSDLGQIALQRGQLAEAESYAQQSLVIDRQVGDRRGEAASVTNLGVIALRRGQLAEAESYFQQALVIRREIGDRLGEGLDLSALGQTALRRGQLAEAESYFQQALVIYRQVGDRQGEGASLTNLGVIALQRGQLAEAESYFQQALVIDRQVGDRRGEGVDLAYLGMIARDTDHDEDAELYFRQSLDILREGQDGPNTASVLSALGVFLITRRSKHAEGCAMLAEAAQLYDDMGIPQADETRELARRLGCNLSEGGDALPTSTD